MPGAYGDLNRLMIWCTRGENCAMCNSLRGRVYSYDMWASAGVWPGFHLNCDCYLKAADDGVPSSDPDFFGTDLKLLSETLNFDWGPLRLHWDAYYQSSSWYMTQQIKEAHLTYGAKKPIGDVLRDMGNQFLGFFKRSNVWDNFFIWRTFRTVQHYQSIDNSYTGNRLSIFRRDIDYVPPSTYFKKFPAVPMSNASLKPETLKPLYPYQSNYTEQPWRH